MSYNCTLHPQTPITHFCESCLDLVCEKCVSKQPHSGTNHKIKQIKDAANVRKNMYAEFVELELNVARSEAQKKIGMLENEKKNAQKDKKVIQKDIKIEFEAINNRLQDRQSQALISCQTQIKHLQNFVHTYDDINQTFDSIYENPQALLMTYKTLDSQLKKLQALKYNFETKREKQKYSDITRQFETTVKKSNTLPQYEARNVFITKMIDKYIENHKKVIKETAENCDKLGKQYQHTFNNIFMKNVTDQTAKVCIFCGFPFTIQYVNQMCANNRTYKINCVYPGNWQQTLPKDVRGSKRHYWIKSNSTHRKRPKMEQHSLVRKSAKKHYYNSLIELQIIKYIMKKHEIETGKSFSKVVEDNDTNKNGYISKIAFVYTMNKVYNVSNQQIETMVNLLGDEQGVNYSRLDELLSFPVEDYLKFVAAQQQAEKAKPVAPQSVYSRFKY